MGVRLPRLSPPAYRRLALATLVALVLVSVVGAGVRLTGSGLGCSTWPACEPDSFTPRSASDGHAMIEFVNRLVKEKYRHERLGAEESSSDEGDLEQLLRDSLQSSEGDKS